MRVKGLVYWTNTSKHFILPGIYARLAAVRSIPTHAWLARDTSLLHSTSNPTQRDATQQVADDIQGKTDMQCFHRWTKVFNGGTKGPWSPEDDARVAELVGQIGAKKWSCIAAQLPGRTGKQCRERWHNHLNPHISKVPWTEHEVGCGVMTLVNVLCRDFAFASHASRGLFGWLGWRAV